MPGENTSLGAVAEVSPHDVWAVGYEQRGTTTRTLIEHWNGASWSVVPSPDVQPNMDSNALSRVAAVAPNDVWAVGNSESTTTNIQQTLTEHYS